MRAVGVGCPGHLMVTLDNERWGTAVRWTIFGVLRVNPYQTMLEVIWMETLFLLGHFTSGISALLMFLLGIMGKGSLFCNWEFGALFLPFTIQGPFSIPREIIANNNLNISTKSIKKALMHTFILQYYYTLILWCHDYLDMSWDAWINFPNILEVKDTGIDYYFHQRMRTKLLGARLSRGGRGQCRGRPLQHGGLQQAGELVMRWNESLPRMCSRNSMFNRLIYKWHERWMLSIWFKHFLFTIPIAIMWLSGKREEQVREHERHLRGTYTKQLNYSPQTPIPGN